MATVDIGGKWKFKDTIKGGSWGFTFYWIGDDDKIYHGKEIHYDYIHNVYTYVLADGSNYYLAYDEKWFREEFRTIYVPNRQYDGGTLSWLQSNAVKEEQTYNQSVIEGLQTLNNIKHDIQNVMEKHGIEGASDNEDFSTYASMLDARISYDGDIEVPSIDTSTINVSEYGTLTWSAVDLTELKNNYNIISSVYVVDVNGFEYETDKTILEILGYLRGDGTDTISIKVKVVRVIAHNKGEASQLESQVIEWSKPAVLQISLPNARLDIPDRKGIYGTSSVVIDGKIYIFGGLGTGSSTDSKYVGYIQCYDPVTDTCTPMKSQTVRHAYSSAVAIDGKAYIFGGTGGTSYGAYLNYIYCFDPVKDSCTMVGSLNYKLTQTAAVALYDETDGITKAYIFGGYDGSRRSYIQCFNPSNNECTLMSTKLPNAAEYTTAVAMYDESDGKNKAYIFTGSENYNRSTFSYDPSEDKINGISAVFSWYRDMAVAVINNKAYCFGGSNSYSEKKIEYFDVSTSKVTKVESTFSLRSASAVAIDGKAYIFGGIDYTTSTSSLDNKIRCFDAEHDEIKIKNAQLYYRFFGAPSVVINGKIYIFGGSTGYNNNIKYIQCYDPVTGTCSTTSTKLNYEVAGKPAVAINGKAYILGAYNSSNYSYYILCYDPVTDTCTSMLTMPNLGYYSSAVAIDGKAYIFGGGSSYIEDIYGTAQKTIYCYDPDENKLTYPGDLKKGGYCTSAVAIDGKAYIFGGLDYSTSTGWKRYASIQCFDPKEKKCTLLDTAMSSIAGDVYAVAINGKAYIFQGRTIESYNILEDNIHKEITNPYSVYLSSIVSIGDQAFIIGSASAPIDILVVNVVK